ncbi:MAG TPA: hypothetical protein VNJ02_18860 [Vicinamibacterales bacterium]|nr:hypothetical protein [Vicinamibacterales bacterium]
MKVTTASVVDAPEISFDRADFERAWQRDADLPRHGGVVPETAIVVRRTSPNDFQDRQIYVWIDDEAMGKIRYGDAISRPIEPGPHTVRVFNTMFTRTLTVDVAPGEQVRVQCGTGMPEAGWLLMVFLHVTYLRVWLLRE